MNKILAIGTKLSVSFVLTLVLLELGLRVVPSLIPIRILLYFPPVLRSEIAARRSLPRLSETVLLNRDDAGPPLRLYKPFTQVTIDTGESDIVKTMVMDGMGFCNSPPTAYDASAIELIGLGDSFTWCTSVRSDDTWVARVGARTGSSVYNLGSPGIGLYEYLQVLKSFGLQKSPKVVVLNVYEGNDLRDAVAYQTFRRTVKTAAGSKASTGPCGTLPHVLCTGYRTAMSSPLGRRSYAFNFVVAAGEYSLGQTLEWLFVGRTAPNFHYRLVFPGKVIEFNKENGDVDEVVHARKLHAGEIDLSVFTGGLQALVDLARRHGFTPVIAYTPSAHTAYAGNVVFDDPSLAELLRWYSLEQREYFRRMGQELGYTFVDLTPPLQAAAKSHGGQSLLYFSVNLHLTPAGHDVIAENLSQVVKGLKTVNRRETVPHFGDLRGSGRQITKR